MIYCIGIDPDLDASGVAVAEDGKIKSLECLNLHDLFLFLSNNKDQIKKVYLEAGWLNHKVKFSQSKWRKCSRTGGLSGRYKSLCGYDD